MNKIAILGTGRVATVLAEGLAGAGHNITMGSTNPDEAGASWKASLSPPPRWVPLRSSSTPHPGTPL